ncbi:MAG: hypothetical protein WCF56_06240, partial [Pseudolabrys sp.]
QHIADAAGVSIILILSDINMPGMTGLELLPKAKAARPDVPGRRRRFLPSRSILVRFATKFDTRVERAA